MTPEIATLLAIIGVALLLFSFEWVSSDVVGLGLVVVLALTGLTPKDQAFAGFGSDTVITMLGLLILTATLLRTGVMDLTGRAIVKWTGEHPLRLLLAIMVTVAGLSAFMSNTAATAFFLPVVIAVAQRAKQSPAQFLMPLAFASILSSSVTLISTSTNILISGLMGRYDLAPMGMFELAPVGIPIAVAGIIYMFFLGRRMIPDRATSGDLIEDFGVRPYLTEVVLREDSALIGKTIAEAGLGRDLDLTVVLIIRPKDKRLAPKPDLVLKGGDVLLVEAKPDDLLKIKDTAGIDIKADVKFSDPSLQSEDLALVEALVVPRSPMMGRTLKGARFRERFGLQVLGINRHGERFQRKVSEIPLKMGDVLLLQGHKNNLAQLQDSRSFQILGSVGEARPKRAKAPMAIAIFVIALALGSLKIVPFPIAVIMGAIAAFLTKCITPDDAYREVEWKVLILVGSMMALGEAMDHTGAAEYLAGLVTDATRGMAPIWLIASFFILTVVLTQPMSNAAAAAVVLPIAIQTANQLQLNPRAFVMTIAIAASCSYLTPLEPSCLMVYGPGRYKFRDFLKVGLPLTALIFAIAMVLIPRVWPLR